MANLKEMTGNRQKINLSYNDNSTFPQTLAFIPFLVPQTSDNLASLLDMIKNRKLANVVTVDLRLLI